MLFVPGALIYKLHVAPRPHLFFSPLAPALIHIHVDRVCMHAGPISHDRRSEPHAHRICGLNTQRRTALRQPCTGRPGSWCLLLVQCYIYILACTRPSILHQAAPLPHISQTRHEQFPRHRPRYLPPPPLLPYFPPRNTKPPRHPPLAMGPNPPPHTPLRHVLIARPHASRRRHPLPRRPRAPPAGRRLYRLPYPARPLPLHVHAHGRAGCRLPRARLQLAGQRGAQRGPRRVPQDALRPAGGTLTTAAESTRPVPWPRDCNQRADA
ncbi:hypothetical protein DFP73DRAFT_326165 [Morchella snyderi]|nr:hypothetical protein DFP73DRAFT_326165 [Morchella snyderi]